MTYNVSSFLNQLKTLLVNNASTLATSLTVNYPTITTNSIFIGNPLRVARQVNQYPAIIINPKNKAQDFDEIGLSNLKIARQITIGVDVLCLVQCMSDSQDADVQARTLAKNIEGLLEANIEKSASTSTVDDGWHTCMIKNTIYDGAYSENSQTYQSAVRLEVEFKSWGVR